MLLELRGLQKRFGGVQALKKGDLRVEAGEVHLLMGENGAGKSTMMKIVAGLQQKDGGDFLWQGQPVDFRNPAEAQRVLPMVSVICFAPTYVVTLRPARWN